MTTPQLRLELESELPAELVVGAGTALFVCGWCFAPAGRLVALHFILDGERQPVTAFGMPRLDPLRALHPELAAGARREPASAEDPELRSYRSGFWGIVRIGARAEGALRVDLEATLADGAVVRARLAELAVVAAPRPLLVSWDAGAAPRVAVCMAAHNPPRELLRAQLDSLRAQDHANWRCVISDDGSDPGGQATLAELVGDDARFSIDRSPRRLGFYRNFERALALAPADAEFVALADQDDVWHPDKLSALLAGIGDARLVYSDARIVDPDRRVLADTWWSARRPNHSDLLALLCANAVTGAASLFPRTLLDDALPFPPAQFAHFHDHWLGLVALALGRVAFLERPLYDYVQHGEASLGHAGANRMISLAERLRGQRGLRERVALWRLHYFVDVCRLAQFSAVLTLRCGPRMTPAKRRQLARFDRAETSPAAIAALGLRGLRELVRATPQTLGAEWMLAHAFAWRRLLAASARERPQRRGRLDALPPPSLVIAPGRPAAPGPAPVRALAEKVAPLPFTADDTAPVRVNLLIPTIDLRHLFGGYIAKFNLARRLVAIGHRVRIVTTDPVGPLPSGWRASVEAYSGLAGLFDEVELVFGRESAQIPVSPADAFVASTWWTAHVAHAAVRTRSGAAGRFLYLVQEYEPFTFPMGSHAALAAESYTLPHVALFSSELLRGYFRAHRIGVYADGPAAGDATSASFQNAITSIAPPTVAALAARRSRRLLVYARPEAHAARNMFELALLALGEARRGGAFADGWELRGIGTVERGRAIELGDGARLRLLPRTDQASYAALLREHDVGLALMYTPHPSLVPLEMASAGLVTVTNVFENKTAEAMSSIAGNLHAVAPTVAALASALVAAAAASDDAQRRVAGSHVAWAASWAEAYDEPALRRLLTALAR